MFRYPVNDLDGMIFWFSGVLFLWEFDKMLEAYYMVYFPMFCIIQTGIQD